MIGVCSAQAVLATRSSTQVPSSEDTVSPTRLPVYSELRVASILTQLEGPLYIKQTKAAMKERLLRARCFKIRSPPHHVFVATGAHKGFLILRNSYSPASSEERHSKSMFAGETPKARSCTALTWSRPGTMGLELPKKRRARDLLLDELTQKSTP